MVIGGKPVTDMSEDKADDAKAKTARGAQGEPKPAPKTSRGSHEARSSGDSR